MAPPLRAVIIGAGSVGQRHLRNLLALGQEVVAVADPDPVRLGEIRPLVRPPCVLTGDEGEALDRAADFAVIASPTHLHVTQARAAVARGRHVFVEKPLSHTLEGVDALIEEAVRAACRIMVACNLRFMGSLQLVKRLLDDGRIGRPLSAHAQFGYYLPFWRPTRDYRDGYGARRAMGGGIILDCFHEFDYLAWLLGVPREVFAYAGKVSRLEIDTEDSADVLLSFGDVVANVHLDYLRRMYRRSCDLIGEDGVIVWDYVARSVAIHGKEDRQMEVLLEPLNTEPNQMFLDEMLHFLHCVETGEAPALDAAGGRRVLEIALAAKTSAAEGRPVRVGR